jgi:hypothetical protein
VSSVSGSNVTVTSATELTWYFGAMVFYSTTGSAYTGLTNNTTYWVDTFFRQGVSTSYTFTLRPMPNGTVISSISGGTGVHTFKKIGISLDKDIFHVKDNGFTDLDMLQYEYPSGGRFSVANADEIKDFYFVQTRYDAHNFTLNQTTGDITPLTVATTVDRGTTITPTTATPVGLTLPISFAVTSGALPNGLSLNTTTGSISGTPVEAIASPGRVVIVTATDAGGATAFQTHTFIINATVGAVNPSTVSRENINSGEAMTAINFTTSNLVAPLTWAISSGTLPTGLSFNNTNGSITGTPTEVIAAPGRQVIVRATDVGGLQGFSTITFQINTPPELYAFSSATFTTAGLTETNGPNLAQARSGVGSPAWSNTYLQMDYNGYQKWTVPRAGTYRFQLAGASGGFGDGSPTGNPGGKGRVIRFDIALTQGETIQIVVGQHGGTPSSPQGNDRSGGGGGATTVFRTTGFQLLGVAGGGGASTNSGGTGATSANFGNINGGNPGSSGGFNFGGAGGGSWNGTSSGIGTGAGQGLSDGGGVNPSLGRFAVSRFGWTSASQYRGYGGFGGGGSGVDNNMPGGGGGFGGGNAGANGSQGGGSFIIGTATNPTDLGTNGNYGDGAMQSGYCIVTRL